MSVSFMYIVILFVASKCVVLDSRMNLLIIPAAYRIYIILWHKYFKDRLIFLNIVESVISSYASFSSFILVYVSVDDQLHPTMLNLFDTSKAYFFWCMTNPFHVSTNSISNLIIIYSLNFAISTMLVPVINKSSRHR